MTEFEQLILDSLSYDPAAGTLVWKVDISRKARAGDEAGSWNDGKITVGIRGKQKAAHHVVWFLHHRRWPKGYLKAHDGDLTNLKIDNLFEQSVSDSVSGSKKGAISGVAGVTWNRQHQRWQAHITRNYKMQFLGYFATQDEAVAARRTAEAEPGNEQTPERIEQIKKQSVLRTIWKRTLQHCSNFTVWKDFGAFSEWVSGEPKGWVVGPVDPTKPLGPDNAMWRDKPESKYDRTNPESMKAYRKERREAKPDMYRGHELKRNYGMTVADYAKMLEAQNGVCAICNKPETHVKNGKIAMLAVDHCHTGGQVRGLLCVNCNQGLGQFKDDISTLERAIAYLKSHGA